MFVKFGNVMAFYDILYAEHSEVIVVSSDTWTTCDCVGAIVNL